MSKEGEPTRPIPPVRQAGPMPRPGSPNLNPAASYVRQMGPATDPANTARPNTTTNLSEGDVRCLIAAGKKGAELKAVLSQGGPNRSKLREWFGDVAQWARQNGLEERLDVTGYRLEPSRVAFTPSSGETYTQEVARFARPGADDRLEYLRDGQGQPVVVSAGLFACSQHGRMVDQTTGTMCNTATVLRVNEQGEPVGTFLFTEDRRVSSTLVSGDDKY